MVHSGRRHDLAGELVLLPCEGSPEDVEQPDVIFSPIARVASENDEEWLVEEHGVSIALPGGGGFGANFDDLPNRTEWLNGYSFRRSRM